MLVLLFLGLMSTVSSAASVLESHVSCMSSVVLITIATLAFLLRGDFATVLPFVFPQGPTQQLLGALRVNCYRLIPLLAFIWASCSIIDLTEYCFPATRTVLKIHNIPHFYSRTFRIPTSTSEEIVAVLYSVIVCLVPVITVAGLYSFIASITLSRVPLFNLKLWSSLSFLIWVFVLLNGVGVLTNYLTDPYVGHNLIYLGYGGCFLFLYSDPLVVYFLRTLIII